MGAILGNDFFVYSLIAIVTFLFAMVNTERILAFLHRNSLGQREEIIRLMDLMFMDVDKKKITTSLLLLSFGVGALMFIMFWPRIGFGTFMFVVFTVLGWVLPKHYFTYLYNKRCDRLVDQMVDGMTIMSNGISSGLSVTQSMERVVENLGNPISQEFNLVLSQIRLGKSVEEALLDLGERVPRPDVQMFVTAVNILKETGGNLAETFQTINITVRERQKVEKKIQALTAQGVMQGIIISLVPFILMGVIFAVQPEFISPMFNTTLGLFFLFVMLCLQIIGGIMIKKIVTIKV
jgi:tight adherence protein B